MDSNKLHQNSDLNESQQNTQRIGWIEKHAELISKLEAQYKPSQEIADDLSTTRFYTFSVARYNFLIPANQPSEVLEENTIYPLPLAPDWLLGTCNVRGDIAPVINFLKILTGENKHIDVSQHKLLILGQQEDTFGVLIDALPYSVQFIEEECLDEYPIDSDQIQPFIKSAYKKEGKVWLNLDYAQFIEALAM